MDYLRQVQRGIDFLEAHLGEDIALSDISQQAGVSHWHFLRMFRALTGETLKGYLRGRRLAAARRALLRSDIGVLQVALEAGFSSQASFTRAFRAAYGMPPGKYRAFSGEHVHVDKKRIDERYLRHLAGGVSRVPSWQSKPALTLVGMATHFEDGYVGRNALGGVLPALWDAFLCRLSEVPGADSSLGYGVVQQIAPEAVALEYVAAVPVPAPLPTSEVPQGMVQRAIPAATYALFTHRGGTAHLDETVDYIYGNWLLRSGQRHSYGADLEIYDGRWRGDQPDSEMDYAVPIASMSAAQGAP